MIFLYSQQDSGEYVTRFDNDLLMSSGKLTVQFVYLIYYLLM